MLVLPPFLQQTSAAQEKAAAPAHPVPPKSSGKLYLAPKSLPEMFELLSEYAKQPEEFRVIAGNTGAGVYHDWPLERILIDIKSIPDLTKIEYSKVCKYSKVCELHVTSLLSLCDVHMLAAMMQSCTWSCFWMMILSGIRSNPELTEIQYRGYSGL